MKRLVIGAMMLAFLGVSIPANVQAATATKLKLKVKKVTGVVHVKRGGKIIMTLKPGDILPDNLDADVSFSVIDGTVKIEIAGQQVTGTAGSNFEVTAKDDQIIVRSGEGVPVEIQTTSGHAVVLTENTTVELTQTDNQLAIEVVSGRALMSDLAGGETKILNAGDETKATVTKAPPPEAEKKEKAKEEPKKTEAEEAEAEDIEPTIPEDVKVEPETSVIPTQEEQESEEVVSPSAP